MTLVRVNQFHTSNPQQLDRELNAIEDNVSQETASIRNSYTPRLTVRRFTASATVGNVALLMDQQLTLDTSIANGTAVLPPLIAANYGKRSVIICPSGLNTRKVACQIATDTIGLSTFPASIGTGVTEIFCDSTGYWIK